MKEKKRAQQLEQVSQAADEETSIQETILKALDEKQQKQLGYLSDLVKGVDLEKLSNMEGKGLEEVKELLKSFEAKYEEWKQRGGNEKELEEILKSAAFHKVAKLMKIDGDVASVESATVTLVAALREKQAKEQRTLEQVMVSSEVDDQQLLEFYRKKSQESWNEDVSPREALI